MSLHDEIRSIAGLELHEDHDLTSYTTMRLKSRGTLVEVASVAALQKLLPLLTQHQQRYLVIGWGANQILPSHCDAYVIHLTFPGPESALSTLSESYLLPASIGLNLLTAHAVKFNLKGWEVFTGIPASLGGAIYMNAGTNLGEIGKLVKSVTLVTKKGEIKTVTIHPESFTYRKNHFVKPGDVIVSAELTHLGVDAEIGEKIKSYLGYRKQTQPLATRNCGCVFKNPQKEIPAGKLIDLIGLKGIALGGLRISPKHGNFIENVGDATWEEFQALLSLIQHSMDHFYGIEFELEVKIPYHEVCL